MAVEINCRKCKVPMVPGRYIKNTFRGLPDFIGDTNGCTLSIGGPGKLANCMKCPECGKSLRFAELEEPDHPPGLKKPGG